MCVHAHQHAQSSSLGEDKKTLSWIYYLKEKETVKNLPSMQETLGKVQHRFSPWGRSPGEGNDNPLQDSCLENRMDRGACEATVHGVTESRTRLSN